MLPGEIGRNKRTYCGLIDRRPVVTERASGVRGTWLDNMSRQGALMFVLFTNPRFWDKKIRIGILALATFIAMC